MSFDLWYRMSPVADYDEEDEYEEEDEEKRPDDHPATYVGVRKDEAKGAAT